MSEEHLRPVQLWSGVVLRVTDDTCHVLRGDFWVASGYAPSFPTPHRERVSPGHRVALATAADGRDIVVWRWYDAVVIEIDHGAVRLWEPAHGEVHAVPRPTAGQLRPGGRAYVSAGLPGADWWVAGPVSDATEVELDAVDALYTEHGLWADTLRPS